MTTEAEYKKELAEAGVDLPEVAEEPQPEPTEATPEEPQGEPKEPEAKPEQKAEEKPEEPKEPTEPLQEPKEPRKRSIYDEYKDKKSELKTERELREQAERERDELRQKYEAVKQAGTPEEKREAQDDLEAFAQEIGADPQAIKRMRELFIKDLSPQGLSEQDRKDLEEFRTWKSQNQQVLEKQMFEEEFQAVTPTLKEMFPTADSEEMEAIKKELDRISHTKEFHDKDLDYVAFKSKEKLSALVSPKKRGIESKERKDVVEGSTEFDPDADLSKMTPAQLEAWEAEYNKLTANNSLADDGKGGKIFI